MRAAKCSSKSSRHLSIRTSSLPENLRAGHSGHRVAPASSFECICWYDSSATEYSVEHGCTPDWSKPRSYVIQDKLLNAYDARSLPGLANSPFLTGGWLVALDAADCGKLGRLLPGARNAMWAGSRVRIQFVRWSRLD